MRGDGAREVGEEREGVREPGREGESCERGKEGESLTAVEVQEELAGKQGEERGREVKEEGLEQVEANKGEAYHQVS